MALHKGFPETPYAILDPAVRWFPVDEALRETSAEKLMPPLVPQLRKRVKEWPESGSVGATDTSKSLRNWCFGAPRLLPRTDSTRDMLTEILMGECRTLLKLHSCWLGRPSAPSFGGDGAEHYAFQLNLVISDDI